MGTILRGKCNNCGYESGALPYGGGFSNFKTSCKYPVMNKIKEEVEVANIMDREEVIKQNPHLVFYDDDSLSDKKVQAQSGFHKWRSYRVYWDGYICPKCYRYSLSFDSTGCWD